MTTALPSRHLPSRACTETLRRTPFTCRKAGCSPFLRELIILFGRTGYVALFEIVDAASVVVAVRLQLEYDYHRASFATGSEPPVDEVDWCTNWTSIVWLTRPDRAQYWLRC